MAVHEEPSDAGGEPASSLEESPSQSIEDSDHHRLENGAQNEADDTVKIAAVPDFTGENNEKCYEYDGCDQCERAEDVIKGRIYVAHFGNKPFIVPFAMCQTWKEVEERIVLSFGDNEEGKKEFLEGKFSLYEAEGSNRGIGPVILKEHWEMLAVPYLSVVVKLDSQKIDPEEGTSDSESESSELEEEYDPEECEYFDQVRYTVDYYRKAKYSFDDDELLWSVSFNQSLALQQSGMHGAKVVPVLEEKRTVIGSPNAKGLEEPAPDQVPRLKVTDEASEPTLHINSPFLLNCLRAVIRYTSNAPSGDKLDELKTGIFYYPYQDLFHHKSRLLLYKEETGGHRSRHSTEYNKACDRHIDVLVDYLNQHPEIEPLAAEHNWTKKVPVTTFSSLWLLLQPGEDVYVGEDGQLNAYVVHSVSGGTLQRALNSGRTLATAKEYTILVWNIVYDGDVIRRKLKSITVPVFNGEKAIKSLPIFPTRFQDEIDDGARRRDLIQRGRKLFDYSKRPSFLEYTGVGMKEGSKKHHRSRVVVDHKSQPWLDSDFDLLYSWNLSSSDEDLMDRSRAAYCECNPCADFDAANGVYVLPTFKDYDDINPNAPGEVSDRHYLLCMSHMYGFVLKDRVYDLLDVSGLSDPILSKNAIENLVMRPESNKDTIKAIVQTYGGSTGQSKQFHADFIHGKGEGQIFLLHGPPGTGKTLTAESVAEFTKRPLLSITAADLGHDPIDLERNLLRFFKDAKNWDAIVLLDEADVYLERRSSSDLRRNSIVSIFLRALEYFEGILFLTTNRVGHFDEAFLSRIHVSIGYEPLNDEARGYIWDNLLTKLKEEYRNGGRKIQYDYDVKQYVKKDETLKKLKWNGREIRNAFQTAVALAIYDAEKIDKNGGSDEETIPELKEKHLMQVVSMSMAFKQYITATHGDIGDSDYAYQLGHRNDKFQMQSISDSS